MSDHPRHPGASDETERLDLGHEDPQRPPLDTGDPDADAVLHRLWSQDRSAPEDELSAFRDALDELTGLTKDQPRLPGQP
ncbi:hypothetical protein [Micrococcus terreus]|uniref:hypothetical protein n=1 Tax=Micrococcus terreus TaxID=574650 RepID=UPI002550851F|nr:hypothetical protein [Micrococcus terreus]MDK7701522.1 hypothetical protein [Micrococcus terreus]WOO98591.1 hypothetical protein R3I42_05545 [Micrococcus terreus]